MAARSIMSARSFADTPDTVRVANVASEQEFEP